MTDEQRSHLRKPFPPELVGTKSGGGRKPDASFVGHGAVTDRLLEVDPDWTWEPVAWEDGEPKFVRDSQGNPVAMWARLTVCGVTRPGVGTVDGNPQSGEAEKELIGDFLRNAGLRFGVALDLWIRGTSDTGEGGRQSPVERPSRAAGFTPANADAQSRLRAALDGLAEHDPERHSTVRRYMRENRIGWPMSEPELTMVWAAINA